MDPARAPARLRRRADAESEVMAFQTFLFYVFAAILVFAGVRVVTARNPVHAVLWLVLAFFTAAAHWLMLQAEFLAIVLVLVYVGAVMVLFLFVVMMLDVNFDSMRRQFRSYVPVGATVGALVLIEMALTLVGRRVDSGAAAGGAAAVAAAGGNTKALGMLVYTEYVYPFEIAAVILLVAIIAAIALTHRKRRDSKYQKPGDQVKVRPRDRLRVLSMPSEKKQESQ
jgi:NADH-quinone oxidoreductase subunit J